MKKSMTKRMISICMVMVLLLGMCTSLVGCGKKATTTDTQSEFQKDPNLTYLTRGEWIKGLAQTMGMTETVTEDPYFTDIDSNHELFSYVQSAADWELFEELDVDFNPDEDATREFVIATAVIAADVLEDAGYVEKDEDYESRVAVDYGICIEYFMENGSLTSSDEAYLAEPVDVNEAQEILDWALKESLSMIFEEEINVVWQENVVDMTSYTTEVFVINENEVEISSSVDIELEVGDVFITPPTEVSPSGEARKVVSVSQNASGNWLVTTETPAVEEIFEELQINQVAVPDYENIIFYEENIQALLGEDSLAQIDSFEMLAKDKSNDWNPFSNELAVKMEPIQLYQRFGVNTENGLVISAGYGDETTKVKNLLGQEGYNKLVEAIGDSPVALDGEPGNNPSLKKIDKFEAEFFLENTLSIDELAASLELDISPLGVTTGNPVIALKELGFNISLHVEDKLKLGGKFEAEEMIPLKLAEIPFVFAGGLVIVNTAVKAYVDGNGYLEFVFDFGGDYGFDYKRLKAPKFTAKADNEPVDIKCGLEVETGIDLDNNVKIMAIDMMNTGFKTGTMISYEPYLVENKETTEDEEYITTTITGYAGVAVYVTAPVVKAYVKSGVLKDLLNYEAETEVIGENGAIKQIDKEAVWASDNTQIYQITKTASKNGTAASEDFETVLEQFVNAPANAQCSYENFYEKAGAQAFVSHLKFLENPNDLTQTQQYIAGTNFSYTEEDMVFGDGSTLTNGAQLTFETQEDDRWDRDYSIIWYEEGGLQRIRTDRVHTDTRNPGIVGNVGGFSDFLGTYKCATLMDCIEVFGLSDAFVEEVQQREPDYYEIINTEKYGAVEVYLNYYADFTSEVKELIFVFQDDSGCPYKEIFIDERLANTLTAEIPILRVEAYTPLAYD